MKANIKFLSSFFFVLYNSSYQRGQMLLEVYAHKTQIKVDVLHLTAQNTGRAGLANKGGIVSEILINGHTKLSFLTAHLEAHEGYTKYQTRCKTITDIFDGTKVNKILPDISSTSHYSFVMGDLNFRTELNNCNDISEDEHKDIINDLIKQKDWNKLNDIDELGRAIKNKECLVGYNTLLCNFPPTFKVERQTGYKYINKRRPSYTDRILWKTSHELNNNIKPLIYEPIDNFTSSDHKPIRSAFSITMNEPFQLRPKMVRNNTKLVRSNLNLNHEKHKNNIAQRFSKQNVNSNNINDTTSNSIIAYKERLHLFVTEIKCNIFNDSKQISNTLPDPYICLISNPEALLRFPCTSKFKSLKQKFLRQIRLTNTKDYPIKGYLTSKGWPRTTIQNQTFTPNWLNEEIHVEIKTHENDGLPIDLTGSMLHICVMDHRLINTGGDPISLGSFTYNLINLIRSCRPSSQESSRKILTTRILSSTKSNKSVNRNTVSKRRLSSVKSLMSLFQRPSTDDDDDIHDDLTSNNNDDLDPIISIQLNEPLVLNGIETGRISCRVEGWWMDEKTAKLFGHSGLNSNSTKNLKKIITKNEKKNDKGRKKKIDKHSKNSEEKNADNEDHSSTDFENRVLNGTTFGTTSDGHKIMLTDRKQARAASRR